MHELVKKGMLSYDMDNNFSLHGADELLNPRTRMLPLYFTRRRDAISYAEAMYANAHYPISVS